MLEISGWFRLILYWTTLTLLPVKFSDILGNRQETKENQVSTMITEMYNAFKKAGVPEKEAQDAAEALSNETTATKSDVENLDKKMIEIAGEIKILKWMIGLVIAINVIPLLKDMLN